MAKTVLVCTLFGLTAAAIVANALVGGVSVTLATDSGLVAATGLDTLLHARLAGLPAALCLAAALLCAGARRWRAAGLLLAGYGVNAAMEGAWRSLLSGDLHIGIDITETHLLAVGAGLALAALARGLQARDAELAEFV